MPNPITPTDWNVELENIERQRKYAEMLRQQGMEPLKSETAGGYVVPISPLQGLAKMLQSYGGRRGEEIAIEQARDLANKRNKAMADALRGAYSPIQTPAKEAQMGEMGETVEPAVPAQTRMPTPQESLTALESSNIPELQQSALAQRQFMAQKRIEQQMQDETMIRNLNFAKALGNPGGAPGGGGMSPIMKLDPKGGLGVEFNPFQQGDLDLKRAEFSDKTGRQIGGAPLGTVNPMGNVSPVVGGLSPQGQRELEKEIRGKSFEGDYKQVSEWRDEALKSMQGKQFIQGMRNSMNDPKGVYSGAFVEGRTGAANFLATLTPAMANVDWSKLENTQKYTAYADNAAAAILKSIVGSSQISDADRNFVKGLFPRLSTQPQARAELLGFLDQLMDKKINTFNRADTHLRQHGSLRGFDYFTDYKPGTSNGVETSSSGGTVKWGDLK